MSDVFHFGTRRILRVGPYARAITLPKDWLRNAGIENFGEVEIFMDQDNNLILKPVKVEKGGDPKLIRPGLLPPEGRAVLGVG